VLQPPQRRLDTLTELAASTAVVKHLDEACERVLATLEKDSSEMGWASISLIDADGGWRHAGGTTGMPPGRDWPLMAAVGIGQPVVLDDRSAVLVPLRTVDEASAFGILVVGLKPAIGLDDDLLHYFAQVGQQVETALTVANLRSQAGKHVQAVALQDHALQTFFVIGLLARAALAELPPEQASDSIGTALGQIIDVAATGREHLREAVLALGRSEPGRGGLVETLQTLAQSFQDRTGIDAEVIVSGRPRTLPIEAIETLYHAAAEALANIERHSQTGAVILSLQIARRNITLSIHDDGVDISNPSPRRIASSTTHVGLRGVGLQVRRMGGSFLAKPLREGGFVVRTRLPLNPTSY
jgi:anti-sigma regulatory factor (Ser/Thr protein kinase)